MWRSAPMPTTWYPATPTGATTMATVSTTRTAPIFSSGTARPVPRPVSPSPPAALRGNAIPGTLPSLPKGVMWHSPPMPPTWWGTTPTTSSTFLCTTGRRAVPTASRCHPRAHRGTACPAFSNALPSRPMGVMWRSPPQPATWCRTIPTVVGTSLSMTRWRVSPPASRSTRRGWSSGTIAGTRPFRPTGVTWPSIPSMGTYSPTPTIPMTSLSTTV